MNMSAQVTVRKAVIVGAGPVGCLAGISLAKQGWLVEIYERRPDSRLESSKSAILKKSINLTLSARGIAALQALDPGASERLVDAAIPVHSRMVHDTQGGVQSQPYDKHGKGALHSIDRALLNAKFVDDAAATPNVKLFFNHKVQSVDFDGRMMSIRTDVGEEQRVRFDLCVGADGSYSAVRRMLMQVVRMDYQQLYIPHEYLELRVPAGIAKDGKPEFRLDPHHLHVWPRQSFMLLALPNKDKTFTCTLFAPHVEFERLSSPEIMVEWFKKFFPDVVELLGEDLLLKQLTNNPRSPLIALKAKPYHYKDCAIILGDAAHAMVPFYGQGLNCGLEDIRVLDFLLRKHEVQPASYAPGGYDMKLARALQEYSDTRHDDLVAMSDLALAQYTELRHTVATPMYQIRKAVDNFLYAVTVVRRSSQKLDQWISTYQDSPFLTKQLSGWLPLYVMITFRPDINYATAVSKARQQAKILLYVTWVVISLIIAMLGRNQWSDVTSSAARALVYQG